MEQLEAIRYVLEYFNIRSFLENNDPVRLILLLAAVLLLLIAAYIICELIKRKIVKYASDGKDKAPASAQAPAVTTEWLNKDLFARVMSSLRRLLFLLILGWGLGKLIVGPLYAVTISTLFTIACTIAAISFITSIIPLWIDIYLRRRGSALEHSQARALLPIVKGAIWAVGGTFLLDSVGLHVSTIIAGLGIAGVAVGLAGQAILRDFFSYLVILLDKPFTIGDFIELSSGKSGSVEYLGPKSTRLRSLDGNLVVCANSEMTSGILVNQGNIIEREVALELGVAYSNPMPVVRKFPDTIKDVVNSFPQCRFERCCMLNFGTANYLFQLIYKVKSRAGDLNEFMNTQSEVNLAIQDKLNQENIPGAYPTQTILLTDMTPAKQAQTAQTS